MRLGTKVIPAIGEFVQYVPSKRRFVVQSDLSGHADEQIFYPFKTKLWRIFRIDKSGIQLISAEGVGNLILANETGYRNAIEVLQLISGSYVNPKFAVEGRSLGYQDGSIGRITTSMSRRYVRSHMGEPYIDEHYVSDIDWLYSNKILMPREIVWLASRFMSGKGETFDWTYFGVRSFARDVHINTLCGRHVYVKQMTSQGRCKVYTIIALKPEVKIKGGEGTKEQPYKIII